MKVPSRLIGEPARDAANYWSDNENVKSAVNCNWFWTEVPACNQAQLVVMPTKDESP
jgi:hypothetical protein